MFFYLVSCILQKSIKIYSHYKNDLFQKAVLTGNFQNLLTIFLKSLHHPVKNRLFPANIYLIKINNRNTRKRCEICSISLSLPFPKINQSFLDFKAIFDPITSEQSLKMLVIAVIKGDKRDNKLARARQILLRKFKSWIKKFLFFSKINRSFLQRQFVHITSEC